MEVVVPRQEKSKQHAEDKLEFSRCPKTFGTLKRKAEEVHKYGNNKLAPEGEEETMESLKRSTEARMEVTCAQREQSNQDTVLKPDKISKCSGAFGISKKRKVQEIHNHDVTRPKAEGKEDILACSKRSKLPSKKGDEPKKLTASNKKSQFQDDFLVDNLEEDEEMHFILKTKSRSRARTMDNMMVTIFLNAYFLHLKIISLIFYDNFFYRCKYIELQ